MKKLFCAFLCVMMLMVNISGYAAITYTLPEKMQKQLEIGSGLKGTVQFHCEGSNAVSMLMQSFQDVELQIRAMKNGEEIHAYFYQSGENDEQNGLTELYFNSDNIYFRSDLLPETVYSLPNFEKLLDLSNQSSDGNPSFRSALYRLICLSDEERSQLLDPVVEKFSQSMELWLGNFASVSEIYTNDNDVSRMDIVYTIPMKDVTEETISLLHELLNDDDGKKLIDAILTDDQKGIYTNSYLDYYYQEAMMSLNNNYDIVYTKTISTLGETISSILELPLDENKTGFSTLLIEEKEAIKTYSLRNDDYIISILVSDPVQLDEQTSIWFVSKPNPENVLPDTTYYHALRIDFNHSISYSTDEDNKDHQYEIWNVSTERDTSKLPADEDQTLYPEEDPWNAELNLHFYSRYSQSSPTTLELTFVLTGKDLSMNIQSKLKTASPWVFSPFEVKDPIELMSLTPGDRTLKFAEFIAAAGETYHENVMTEIESPEGSESSDQSGESSD